MKNMIAKSIQCNGYGHCFSAMVAGLALIGLFAAGAYARESSVNSEADISAGGLLPADPRFEKGMFENGLHYVLSRNSFPSDRLSLRMVVHAGSLDEKTGQNGVAHFLEHMAFNGTRRFPEGTLSDTLSKLGVQFGAHSNATTNFRTTVYSLDFPSADAQSLKTGLAILRDMAGSMTLNEEAIERERGVIRSEFRSRYGPEYEAGIADLKLKFPGTPYTSHTPLGASLSDIEAIRRDDLMAFYRAHYKPSNITIVVAGDIVFDVMQSAIAESFSNWSDDDDGGKAPATFPDPPIAHEKPDARLLVNPALAPNIAVNWVIPTGPIADSADKRRDGIERFLALAILDSRLQQAIESRQTKLIGASASIEEFERVALVIKVQAAVSNGLWQASLAFLRDQIRAITEGGIGQSELDREITRIRALFTEQAQQWKQIETPALANFMAQASENDLSLTSGDVDLALFEDVASRASPERIQGLLSRLFSETPPLFFATAPQSVSGFDVQEATRIWSEQSKGGLSAPAAPGNPDSASFAYTDFGPPGVVVKDSREQKLGVRKLQFANGVCLNLLSTDNPTGDILVSTRIGGGLLGFPQTPQGLGAFANLAFTEGGLGKHSSTELRNLAAGRSVQWGMQIQEDHIGGLYKTRLADLDFQLQLVSAYLTDPGYREEAEERAQQFLSQKIPSMGGSAGGVAERDLDAILRNGDARFMSPDTKTIASLNFKTLRRVLTPMLERAPIELAIVGNIDEEKMIAAVSKTLGAIPERRSCNTLSPTRDIRFPEHHAPIILRHQGSLDEALAFIMWKTGDGLDAERNRVRSTLEVILLNRITQAVREDLGLTYSPQILSEASDANIGYGYLGFGFETRPADVDDIAAKTTQVAKELSAQGTGVSQEEVDRAKAVILGQLTSYRQSDEFLLSLASVAQSQPKRIDNFADAEHGFNQVKAEQVRDLARKLFKVSPLQIVILPETNNATNNAKD